MFLSDQFSVQFCLYFSSKIPKNNNVLFTDDNNLYGEVSEENYALDLNNIEKWMAANKFTINQDQIKTIVFTSYKKNIDNFSREWFKNRK